MTSKEKTTKQVSKKLKYKPYIKTEKGVSGVFLTPSGEYVNTERSFSSIEEQTISILYNKPQPAESQRKATSVRSLLPLAEKVLSIPHTDIHSPHISLIKKQSQQPTDDYSYININSVKVPVIHVSGEKYKDIYTEKIIDEQQARKRLEYAGYRASTDINYGMLFIVGIGAMFTQIFGPVVLILIGIWAMKKKSTVLEKEMISGWKLKFEMPATKGEKCKYRTKGVLYIVAGLCIGAYHLSLSLPLFTGWSI